MLAVPSLAQTAQLASITDILLFQSSKVAVLGASGGIGQPLSLLLKLNPRVTELALYDIRLAPGSTSLIKIFSANPF
jgi:lactate/malate dehydrogenase family protein